MNGTVDQEGKTTSTVDGSYDLYASQMKLFPTNMSIVKIVLYFPLNSRNVALWRITEPAYNSKCSIIPCKP